MSRITHDICDCLGVLHHRVSHREPDNHISPTDTSHRIIIAGGNGYLGNLLKEFFEHRGWTVIVLTRSQKDHEVDGFIHWDGRNLGKWTDQLEGAQAVINLAGRSVNCRYHKTNRRQMMDSRINSTRVIGLAIGQCKHPPEVWLNSSTATIYKHTFGPAWDESGEIGWDKEAKDQFSVDIATAWERIFDEAETPLTRKVKLRTAMVLGRDGDPNNAFVPLRRLARLGLGGRMGSGRQYVSWIHESDFCHAIEFIIKNDQMDDVVNVAAPGPLPNAAMMRVLRDACGMAIGLPATNWMLEIGAFVLRTETELIIKSRRVVPGKLMRSGFQFRFEMFVRAVEDLITLTKPTNSITTGGKNERTRNRRRTLGEARPVH